MNAITDESSVTKLTSRDGTEIAYWTSGEGPPLVLVHGTTADHSRWRPVLQFLEPHATVHAMDRRGRGSSGDADTYDAVREFEDVASVIDAVSEASGSAVDVLGHSYGGFCAYGAVTLTTNVRRLVLYEGWASPKPDRWLLPPGLEQRLNDLLAEGRREAVIETFMRDVVRMPDEELAVYRSLPAWQARIAAAHTITRETRGGESVPFDPAVAARINVPVLLLVGSQSPDFLKGDHDAIASALPDARVEVLEGQQHIAMDRVPEVFAERVLRFLRDHETER
jgi:pimeloyl-ACP methyl ester carboxylesterase